MVAAKLFFVDHSSGIFSSVFKMLWQSSLLLFHGNANFWFFFRMFAIAATVLFFVSVVIAWGNCIYIFGTVLPFAFFEPILVYYTLLQDSRWWQGLDISQGHRRNSPTEDIIIDTRSGRHFGGGAGISGGGVGRGSWTVTNSGRNVRLLNFGFSNLTLIVAAAYSLLTAKWSAYAECAAAEIKIAQSHCTLLVRKRRKFTVRRQQQQKHSTICLGILSVIILPFTVVQADGLSQNLIFITEQKSGTALMIGLGKAISSVYGVPFLSYSNPPPGSPIDPLKEPFTIYQVSYFQFRKHKLKHQNYRSALFTRHPFDRILSMSRYLKGTTEKWANLPRGEMNGQSKQEYIQGLNDSTAEIMFALTCNLPIRDTLFMMEDYRSGKIANVSTIFQAEDFRLDFNKTVLRMVKEVIGLHGKEDELLASVVSINPESFALASSHSSFDDKEQALKAMREKYAFPRSFECVHYVQFDTKSGIEKSMTMIGYADSLPLIWHEVVKHCSDHRKLAAVSENVVVDRLQSEAMQLINEKRNHFYSRQYGLHSNNGSDHKRGNIGMDSSSAVAKQYAFAECLLQHCKDAVVCNIP